MGQKLEYDTNIRFFVTEKGQDTEVINIEGGYLKSNVVRLLDTDRTLYFCLSNSQANKK